MVIGNIYVIASVAVVGGGLFGFDISSMSAQLTENAYKCYFNQGPNGPPFDDNENCSGLSALNQGGVTAAMAAGSWLGALISGFVSDRLGRKYSIMLGCVIWVVGSILICAAQNIAMLCVGRVINGLSVGIESAQVPVYISELSAPSKRGRFVGLQQWAITWGILIMYYISYGCSFVGGKYSYDYSPAAWRIPWGLQMIPAVVLFFAMMLLPESPRWLARVDRWEEAHEVLALVHGKGDRDHPFVAIELQDIRDMCEQERQFGHVSYQNLFTLRMINRTMIGLFTQIWSQLTGMNVMMYYISYVFTMAGYSGNSALLSSSVEYIINVFMTLPALLWQDRWGRRPTMLVGAFLMMVFMFANAGILATHATIIPMDERSSPEVSMSISGAASKGLVACTYLFVASYAPTWGPVSWTYPPELFPLRLRGKGVALATSGNWAFNTALGLFTPSAFTNIAWKTYILFGVFNAAMLIHVFFVFPETAGKTLEETETMFEDPNGIKYMGTPAWKTRVHTRSTVALEHGDLEASKAQEARSHVVSRHETVTQ
ncbi:Hexose transporter [Penicillium odoratum]|uniref:Hexose transporter n=1 Tax=Penicillium odoratum TaxID=1167516 RepID=UPI0025485B79|nr:Hexose transporter [Penicillium odoratum]KAJ5777642.1 Hexose transporter [Penicillium odoratum]